MTFIIAEAGSNHNGYYKNALKLIDVAKEAGCDAVKFQTFAADTLFAKNTPDFANYKNIRQIIKDNELPRHWQKDLKKYCDDNYIEFMSTPFDEAAIDELVDLGVKRLKIAGFESTDPRFITLVAKTNLPIIISIGIKSSYKNINNVYKLIREYNDKEITFLHCNNAYPTPYQDINLLSLKSFSNELTKVRDGSNVYHNVSYGLSDHTLGPLIPCVAVGMGATYIEKHFTLDKTMDGPDHHFAVNPIELKEMVDNIRTVELASGYKRYGYTNSEMDFKIGTRAVVAKANIAAGEIFTIDNITTKRPCTTEAIPAQEFFNVIGLKAAQNIREDELLTWKMIQH